jgi:hypothetical protein
MLVSRSKIDQRLDGQEFSNRPNAGQFILGGVIKENQAIQGPKY